MCNLLSTSFVCTRVFSLSLICSPSHSLSFSAKIYFSVSLYFFTTGIIFIYTH